MSKNVLTPRIRFKGFAGDWEQRKLGDFVKEVTRTDSESDAPVMMITAGNGFIAQSDRYAFDNAGASLKRYILLKKGELAYNHGASKLRPYGSCFALTNVENARVPFVYHCFTANDQNSEFLSIELNGKEVEKQLKRIVSSGARMDGLLNISFTDYATVTLYLPEIEEQNKISSCFGAIDKLISLYNQKAEKLKNIKKALLEKMFPKEGETEPRMRLKGFSGAWKQCKLNECAVIERGGSPRPIDDYITNEPDGLNWVKIGDAPEQGNYITKTAEKIRQSGLSKTRQVQIGDLILSNSMSFGKPYIMAIDGCIHDGWLLIRDIKGIFDLQFLCQLLGAEQMLRQYKALAAGSTVNNLNKELVGNTLIAAPDKSEQQRFGLLFQIFDNIITLHLRKVEKLKNIKYALLEKMFV